MPNSARQVHSYALAEQASTNKVRNMVNSAGMPNSARDKVLIDFDSASGSFAKLFNQTSPKHIPNEGGAQRSKAAATAQPGKRVLPFKQLNAPFLRRKLSPMNPKKRVDFQSNYKAYCEENSVKSDKKEAINLYSSQEKMDFMLKKKHGAAEKPLSAEDGEEEGSVLQPTHRSHQTRSSQAVRTFTKLRGMQRDESGPKSWLLTSRQSNATEEHFYRKLEHEAL